MTLRQLAATLFTAALTTSTVPSLRAVELDPNSADAYEACAHILSNTGRHTEALATIKRAREIDPLHLRINALEGQFLLHAGKPDEALEQLQKTLNLENNFWLAHAFTASVYIEKEMYDEAIVEAEFAGRMSGGSSFAASLRAFALAKSDQPTAAQNILDELFELSKVRNIPPYHIALIYNGLGEYEKAFEWLEKACEKCDPKMAFLKVEPKWNNLRSDSRFQDLLRRVGFPGDLLSDLNQLKEQLLVEKLAVPAANDSSPRRTLPPEVGATNKRRRAALIALTVMLVCSVAAAWFYFHRAVPPLGKDTVLLADFTNQTGDDVFDGTLKQGLATQLEQSRFLNVFPEARARQTLRQMERPSETRITAELAREICERQNLKAFIAGSIAPLGSHYVITLAALRSNNGEELTHAQATATSKEQVLQALAEAARQLRT